MQNTRRLFTASTRYRTSSPNIPSTTHQTQEHQAHCQHIPPASGIIIPVHATALRFNCSCSLQSFHRISPTLVPTNSATTDSHNRPKDHQTIHKYSQYEMSNSEIHPSTRQSHPAANRAAQVLCLSTTGVACEADFSLVAAASGHCSSGQTNLEQSTPRPAG